MTFVTLGSDPELFATDIPNTYLDANRLPHIQNGALPAWYAMQLSDIENVLVPLPAGELSPDGLALEFTTKVAHDAVQMTEFIRQNILATKAFTDRIGGKLSVAPRIFVAQEYINLLPETYGKASSLQILGCDPDYCVYPDLVIPQKPDPKTYNYRTSGGHIHLGIGALTQNRVIVSYLIAALDATIGVASTVLCNSEEAFLRKVLYGKPGMYRTDHKRGTVEYRTAPAQALIQTPDLTYAMFDIATRIGDLVVSTFEAGGQSAVVEVLTNNIGDLDTMFKRAQAISDHDIETCAEMAWHGMIGDLLNYEMPNDFYLHGWQ